jgi:hypothetical protein
VEFVSSNHTKQWSFPPPDTTLEKIMNASITRFIAPLLIAVSLLVTVPAFACGGYTQLTPAERVVQAEKWLEASAKDYADAMASGDLKAQEVAWSNLVLHRDYLREVKASVGELASK